jgi:hypothetical protein
MEGRVPQAFLFGARLVVHEEAVVEVEGVVRGVVHEAEQRLEAARVDGRRRQRHVA